MEILSRLFEQHFRDSLLSITPLQANLGGSGRQIFRLAGQSQTAIGIAYDVREENVAFLSFSRHFLSLGLPVPQIYAQDLDNGAYLLQDLGDLTLYQFLQANREGDQIAPAVLEAYRRVVEVLPSFQIEGGRTLDYSVCVPRQDFDAQSIQWDLSYFKYYFLKLAGFAFDEQALQDDFDRLTQLLLQAPRDFFLYRDFQSRNIMLVEGKPWFLDYQGGRRGALQYDIASLLFDAKADLPPDFRANLLDHYLEALARHGTIDREQFLLYYYPYVYIRILQALGAYGFRGYFERKPHFLASIPYALKNLAWLLDNVELPIALPTLLGLCRSMVDSPVLQALSPRAVAETNPVQVSISSFSFHHGLPQDNSGHGGGFIFDARGLPNPGREAQYKQLTGKDAPVIAYLRKHPAVDQYFSHAAALVDSTIASYQQRGFDHLKVSFGCTGGQHRSVYLAEKLAAQLTSKPGVQVLLHHRELERMNL